MKHRGLVLDLSHRGMARVLVCHLRPLQVDMAETMELGEEVRLGPLLAGLMQRHGVQGVPVRVILSRTLVEAGAYDLPSMPAGELLKAVRLELGREGEHQGALSLSVSPRSQAGAVVAYHLPQEERDALFNELSSQQILLEALVPAGEIPALALDARGGRDEGTLWVEADGTRLSLTLLRGERWALERDFAYRLDEQRPLVESDLERISGEVGRTIQFFKQKNRGVLVSRILLSGCPDAVAALDPYLRQTLGVDASVLSWSAWGRNVRGPAAWSEGEGEAFWPYVPAFLLARAWAEKKPVADMLPDELRERRSFPRQLYLALGVSAALLPLLWGGARVLAHQQRLMQGELTRIEGLVAQARRRDEGLNARLQARGDLLARRRILNHPRRQGDLVARWLIDLTRELGPGLQLTRVGLREATRALEGWEIRMEGRVLEETFAAASQRSGQVLAWVRKRWPGGSWVLTRSSVNTARAGAAGQTGLGFVLKGYLGEVGR